MHKNTAQQVYSKQFSWRSLCLYDTTVLFEVASHECALETVALQKTQLT